MPHWSATRFQLFEQCPILFKERYIDGIPIVPTEAMSFGSAVHRGLEAHYQGQDGIRTFRAYWKEIAKELAATGYRIDPSLTATGLTLLEQVFELELKGIPERGFSIDTNTELRAPIVGAIDLWDQDAGIVYDFKTTIGSWSQVRAQKETWQPCLYSWAFWQETGDFPEFHYIVLNRATGALSRFQREWTDDEALEQMNDAWTRMEAIAKAVADDDLSCKGNHGYCPECGDRWKHEHVCGPTPERVRLNKEEAWLR
jgi:hypothetical protein